MAATSPEGPLVFVGTYTHGASEGIYVFRLDPSSGALERVSVATGIENPTFLAVDAAGRSLYAASTVMECEGRPSGTVSAHRIDADAGRLEFLSRRFSRGTKPCHVVVDRTGRFVLAANYGSGSVCVLPIMEDGRLGEASAFAQHEGSSVHPERQTGPHAHSINLDPQNRYAFAPDLGTDRVMAYRFDARTGGLTPNDSPWAEVAPGSGPRHFDFHPGGRWAYLINEIGNTVTAFAYDAARGALEEIQTVPTLPEGFGGDSACAHVQVSPSGRFLYGSNRGHDSIVIFAIDGGTGRLTYVGHEPTRGEGPRHFSLDAAGRLMLVANGATDSIVAFRVDDRTGRLAPTGSVTQVPSPVCVLILPRPEAGQGAG